MRFAPAWCAAKFTSRSYDKALQNITKHRSPNMRTWVRNAKVRKSPLRIKLFFQTAQATRQALAIKGARTRP